MDQPVSSKGAGAADYTMAFGSADLRLTGRQWLCTLAILVPLLGLLPAVWSRIERFDTGPDYRLPYDLSRDYWLYERRIRRESAATNILMVGDSVVWGEYVAPDGTWSGALTRGIGATNGIRFVNAGVNGLFPLAMEGLFAQHTPLSRGRKVILDCNLLWMTSPERDLSSTKQEQFNHARLVPQFSPRIPAYKADAAERLGIAIHNRVPFLAWVDHLQDAYFGQKSIPGWTLAEDGGDPPKRPNVLKNPLAQLRMEVPVAPPIDPDRGTNSPRHHAWSNKPRGNNRFEWVALDASLQWAAFQRTVDSLRARGIDVFVVVGPFNEHLMAEDNVAPCRAMRDGIDAWLTRQQVPHLVAPTLPSELYADASHPLTAGYELLAQEMAADAGFAKWATGK